MVASQFKGDLPISARLPVEIVRLILEHLGRDSSSEAARLVGISRLVHAWILPVLYHTVAFKCATDWHQIQQNLATNNELKFYIHNVCLPIESEYELEAQTTVGTFLSFIDFVALLPHCPHVLSVHMDINSLPLPYTPTHLPHLVDLHCSSIEDWDTQMTQAILPFRSLTHLRIDLETDLDVYSSCAPLFFPGELPYLTHLALGMDYRVLLASCPVRLSAAAFLRGVLATRPRLVMLVVITWLGWVGGVPYSLGDRSLFKDIADPRLCVLRTDAHKYDASIHEEWEGTARGRQSIWNKGRAIMDCRHKNVASPWGW